MNSPVDEIKSPAPSLQLASKRCSVKIDVERCYTASLHSNDSSQEEIASPRCASQDGDHDHGIITDNLDVRRIDSHVSHPDLPIPNPCSLDEKGDEVYSRFTRAQKRLFVALISLGGFLGTLSSTTILSAIPEVARSYHSTGTIINLSNALYIAFLGLSPIFWGPVATVYGRKWPLVASLALFFAFSMGTALAPNLVAFFIFRMLTAFHATPLVIIGASITGDIYKPVERGTALAWFMLGTLIGPAVGPVLGGVIVTYTSWRVVFWVQTGIAAIALAAVIFSLPETIHVKRCVDLHGLPLRKQTKVLASWMNPMRVIKLFRYPNLLCTGLASSALLWNMYSLLTPIRYVLDPRFHLTNPLVAGLFYLIPGAGFVLGAFVGGRWADFIVKRWIRKRGHRVPEDRLRATLWFLGLVIPASILVYGWGIETKTGGIALVAIAMFVQGIAQLFCFPALNAYCLDVNHWRSAEVIAGNFALRYFFGAFGSAIVLPAIQKIGVGWFSTISAGFLILATGLVLLTVHNGEGWRKKIDDVKTQKIAEDCEKQAGK